MEFGMFWQELIGFDWIQMDLNRFDSFWQDLTGFDSIQQYSTAFEIWQANWEMYYNNKTGI